MEELAVTDYEERRGRSRGRPRGRHRGRPRAQHRGSRPNKRNKIESDEEEEEIEVEIKPILPSELLITQFDKDCDISALEAPTFTTLDRGPPAPMLQLSWNHPVTLIGEKVLSPRIHTCDACDKPILIYGRMIPCKHVFCLWCAKMEDRVCARCGERVIRVEQTGLGTVFMCIFAINDALCKRTYLSQRDLQAHIDHRHTKSSIKEESKEERVPHRDPRADNRTEPRVTMPIRSDPRPPIASVTNDPRVGNKEIYDNLDTYLSGPQFPRTFNPNQPPPTTTLQMATGISHHIPVMTSSRTNLITVPLQDPSEQPPYTPSRPPPQAHPLSHVSHAPPRSLHNPLSHPPPSHQFTSPPPISQPLPYSSSVTSSYNVYPSSQQSPQYTYPPTIGPPQTSILPPPYSATLPPGPVPPPPSSFGSNNRPPYEGQYGTNHWNAPPPQQQGPPPHPSHPMNHPPPGPQRLHHPPNTQTGNYYR